MNRNYWRNKLEHFGVPKHSKIVYYKNPNECNNYYMERVNPTHIGILWGHRKDKSHNWIRIGKVFISSLVFGVQQLVDAVLYLFYYIGENVGIVACFYYIFIALCFYGIVLNIDTVGVFLCGLTRQ